ncbi:DUF3613 domain-containing protein [Xenophilus sp. Marseille-Q4582]|uniref:DUF3613 domain-containing protein n=1 Tax=Xenophilus sp. Marseille-Q4582 TaxID=2866600 RepID=UPI001CE4A4CE|nr:DUF3613 domain-containing protein [Xenophilus sp. Marseille-Q4582]
MHPEFRTRSAAPLLAGLLAAALPLAAGAQAGSPVQALAAPTVAPVVVDAAPLAQSAAPVGASAATAAEPTAAEPMAPAAPRVGESTQHLLALQRTGQLASPVPRPLPGEIAQRSRERYLKSFEHPIPERFQSSVGAKSGQGAGGR